MHPPPPKPTEPPRRPPGPAEEVSLTGSIEGVTYHNPENAYTVLRVLLDKGCDPPGELFGRGGARERLVYAVGKAGALDTGARVALVGEWKNHPKHGPQFHFRMLTPLPPAGREGVVRYLASKNFRGVGPKLAERIVDELGAEALERIDKDPEILRRVRGMKREVREGLAAELKARRGERELASFLYGLELHAGQVLEAVRVLGGDGLARVNRNPYVLARLVKGIGFSSADRAAAKLGVASDGPERRRAALLFTLEEAGNEGHSCLPLEALAARAGALLGAPLDPALALEDAGELARTNELVLERELVEGTTLAYAPPLAACEEGLARNLAHLLAMGSVKPLADETRLAAEERRARIALHASQRAAVLGCLSSPVALLTGGPGVGKTTIVKLVVELAERAGLSVALASPTGRAAKRLSEATERPASTVHRLLGWNPQAHGFEHDHQNPLAAGLVIVDEISMLDVALAHHLLKAVQPPTRLVLVGDPDQLPSVSAGNVLADLLRSERVPVFRLQHVFRQEAKSLIVENAHNILAGEAPRLPARDDPGGDFFFFPAEDEETTADRLIEVVTQRIPRRFGLDWFQDVQVLAPMYRGACGVDRLNDRLREALASGGAQLSWNERVWRVGDRVIQTRNDYDKDVFNGDMGRIVRIDTRALSLTVLYPEGEVEYSTGELADLSPAFAITVHRSQGGEFPAVVMPLVTQHWPMLQRNLLYTAVTRARRLVVLVGQMRALERALQNAEQGQRVSALAERLRRRTAMPGA